MNRLPVRDLDLVVETSRDDLRCFDGARILLTGGTGFVGSWLVESVQHAQRELGISLELVVPSRDPDGHLQRQPHLRHLRNVQFFKSDIRQPLDRSGRVDAIIHAATAASAELNESNPAEMVDVIVRGMSNVLHHASSCGAIPVLFTSSGAVYGRQPPEVSHVAESYLGAPDVLDPLSAYHEGKRIAELLGAIESARSEIRFVVGRMFAFLGPLLPLDAHFAAGNFIADGLAGRPIRIGGDGSPRRTYQHPVDMCISLWALLARGQDRRAYNIGSEHDISIAELAMAVATECGGLQVHVAKTPNEGPAARYVPSTERIRSELGVVDKVGLRDAIARTMAWHRNPPSS